MTEAERTTRLEARDLTVSYATRGGAPVLRDLGLAIPDGVMTVIVGPNACGKSTLLRTLARMHPAAGGAVYVDGRSATDYGHKELARVLGLLPQSPSAPDGITVADLVAKGRYPHQSLLRQWSRADEEAVAAAVEAADVAGLTDRPVDELSGGQRQRVWLAMALAQETPLLLLDEPTTYLDIAHQLEVLELARRLARGGRTVVTVLHELQLAFRYADHLVVMSGGRVVASGDPRGIVTADLIEEVYDLPCRVIEDPLTGTPLVLPLVGTGAGTRDGER
ncbi:ABC transporter ATP-binding protein [Nocardioides sp. KR10-350]|uniref:ABC transporter ATP-binding protein n=1 Tax=Nocardioides cheoyonin TaxID=3156615 RepID=UPI0032B39306